MTKMTPSVFDWFICSVVFGKTWYQWFSIGMSLIRHLNDLLRDSDQPCYLSLFRIICLIQTRSRIVYLNNDNMKLWHAFHLYACESVRKAKFPIEISLFQIDGIMLECFNTYMHIYKWIMLKIYINSWGNTTYLIWCNDGATQTFIPFSKTFLRKLHRIFSFLFFFSSFFNLGKCE